MQAPDTVDRQRRRSALERAPTLTSSFASAFAFATPSTATAVGRRALPPPSAPACLPARVSVRRLLCLAALTASLSPYPLSVTKPRRRRGRGRRRRRRCNRHRHIAVAVATAAITATVPSPLPPPSPGQPSAPALEEAPDDPPRPRSPRPPRPPRLPCPTRPVLYPHRDFSRCDGGWRQGGRAIGRGRMRYCTLHRTLGGCTLYYRRVVLSRSH